MRHSLLAQRHASGTDAPAGHQSGAGAGDTWDAAIRRGDFAGAWAVSDAVLAARDPATRDDPRLPFHERWVWDGRAFDGARVVVRCYHGLGDTLQFCRYLPALRARAGHVTLEVQAALVGLLRGVPGVDRLVPFDPAAPLPPGECDIEVMELAHALRLVPDRAPYLVRPAVPATGRLGLCWAAGGWDPDRNMPAAALQPLLARAECVSLQRGAAAREGAALGLVDPLGGDMDLLRLQHLVAGLGAVVTVDTMVAHLAGAMGVPALLLLKVGSDWRWGSGGASVWYRSARLFRQVRPGGWDDAVKALSFSGALEECSRVTQTAPLSA